MMSETAVHEVLPGLDLKGDLNLDYPLEDPEFYRSYIEHKDYKYYLFGLFITIILLLGYLLKVCILPDTKIRGQIIPHIFAIKCGGLALYPTYG